MGFDCVQWCVNVNPRTGGRTSNLQRLLYSRHACRHRLLGGATQLSIFNAFLSNFCSITRPYVPPQIRRVSSCSPRQLDTLIFCYLHTSHSHQEGLKCCSDCKALIPKTLYRFCPNLWAMFRCRIGINQVEAEEAKETLRGKMFPCGINFAASWVRGMASGANGLGFAVEA